FSEFRIGEAEGLHKGYERMQKILSQRNQLKAKLEDEDINLKFLRAFPSSWSQVALNLKTKGPSHSAFVSATSASKKISYGDSPSYSLATTYSVPSNSKTGSHRSEKLDLEEMDLKWQIAMLSVRVHKFEQKVGRKIDFDKKESARFNKKKDEIKEGAAKIYNLITGADTKEASTAGDAGEFALMGVTFE
nr:ribonuclease H-like domain-containing protein [Tanacetum cinerariifolium]